MKPVEAKRFGSVSTLPDRPKPADPIGDMLQTLPQANVGETDQTPTGSVEQQ